MRFFEFSILRVNAVQLHINDAGPLLLQACDRWASDKARYGAVQVSCGTILATAINSDSVAPGHAAGPVDLPSSCACVPRPSPVQVWNGDSVRLAVAGSAYQVAEISLDADHATSGSCSPTPAPCQTTWPPRPPPPAAPPPACGQQTAPAPCPRSSQRWTRSPPCSRTPPAMPSPQPAARPAVPARHRRDHPGRPHQA